MQNTYRYVCVNLAAALLANCGVYFFIATITHLYNFIVNAIGHPRLQWGVFICIIYSIVLTACGCATFTNGFVGGSKRALGRMLCNASVKSLDNSNPDVIQRSIRRRNRSSSSESSSSDIDCGALDTAIEDPDYNPGMVGYDYATDTDICLRPPKPHWDRNRQWPTQWPGRVVRRREGGGFHWPS